MAFGKLVLAGESDDGDLIRIHGVFSSKLILIMPQGWSWGTQEANAPAPERDGVLCWGDRSDDVFGGAGKAARAGRGARVKPVAKTEKQTIQRREHGILEKHHSGSQSVRQTRSDRNGWVPSH